MRRQIVKETVNENGEEKKRLAPSVYITCLLGTREASRLRENFDFKEPKDKKIASILAVRDYWTQTHTAESIGLERSTISRWKKDDSIYKEAFEDSFEKVTDDLRVIVQQNARGEIELDKTRALMIFFELKRRDPTYRENYQIQHEVSDRLAKILERHQELMAGK